MSKKQISAPDNAGPIYRMVLDAHTKVASKVVAANMACSTVTVSLIYDLERGIRLNQIDSFLADHGVKGLRADLFDALMILAQKLIQLMPDSRDPDVRRALLVFNKAAIEMEMEALDSGNQDNQNRGLDSAIQHGAAAMMASPHFRSIEMPSWEGDQ